MTNKYHEMDQRFCQFIDTCINTQGFLSNEDKTIYELVKKVIIEHPNELDEIRGKYIIFQNRECLGYYETISDIQHELRNAVIIFIPNEHRYCDTAHMPYREAINKPKESWLIKTIRNIWGKV